MYVNGNNVIHFDSFEVEHIPKEIWKFIKIKNIITSIYDSIMHRCFCIGFIDFILEGKSLLDYTNSFFPNDYEKNDQIK